MTQEAASYRGEVEQLRRRFEEYRSTHAVRSRLPDQLWAAAAKLVKEDGIESTARALDVDRPSLQKWTERFDPGAQGKPHKTPRQRQAGKRDQATPAFVEILAESAGAALRGGAGTSCLVEVETPRGAKLRLELKALPISKLAGLIRAFAAS